MGLPRKGDQRMFLEEEAAYKGEFWSESSRSRLFIFIFILKYTFQIHANQEPLPGGFQLCVNK